MSGSELTDTVAAGRRALARLGLDGVVVLDQISAYLSGPPIVAVAGLPGSGRSTIATRLTGPAHIVEVDARTPPDPRLWDLLVVTTPADQALSAVELDLVERVRRQGSLAVVAVTFIDLLGADEPRRSAEAELGRHRLAGALEPLGVRWCFTGDDTTRTQLAGRVSTMLAAGPDLLHAAPAAWWAAETIRAAVAQLGERVAVREREFELLRQIEAQVPLSLAYLDEEVNHARLGVRDTCRLAEAAILDQIGVTAQRALEWANRKGVGPWSDVELPLRRGFDEYLSTVDGALDLRAKRFADETGRLLSKVTDVAATLDLGATVNPPVALGSWVTPAARAALDAIHQVDIGPALAELAQGAETGAADDEPDDLLTERPPPRMSDGPRRGRPEFEATVKRAIDGVRRVGGLTRLERLRLRLAGDIEMLLRVRADVFLDAASAAAAEGARADADAVATLLRQNVAALRTALEQRHAWGYAYRDLLEISGRLATGR